MIFPTPDAVLESQVERVEQRFRLFLAEPEAFLSLVARGLTFQASTHPSEKLGLAKLGFFSLEILQAMISGGSEYRMESISFIWDRLVAAEVVAKAFAHLPGAFADHILDRSKLAQHLGDNTFVNLFWPPSSLVRRYATSVIAIDVLKDGSAYRGSGFILHVNGPLLVTCKHNVDPAEKIEIQQLSNAAGGTLPLLEFNLHEKFDLAIARLSSDVAEPHFRAGPKPHIFDSTFTIGYPNVPHAEAGVVGHRGEVNGFAQLYLTRCPIVLISNLVSPGSSGGPVLSSDGHCLGMTVQWLEGEYEGGQARFSAAIPVREIVAFAAA
ncbi:MAG TPA: serine protease [Allosphingosinicella sp.]|jgi:S1-C subfamily serine protease